ncbi:MAG TPA: polysaccharide biosynthesis protein, partial [Caulobacteraceae bacterium]|nr:polysaccharide biosynthesis protein [Caulobacteraceae bacterium]
INLYGATKLVSDKLFRAANAYAGAHRTRFSVVRYGNVVGSRGSVVPYFKRLAPSGLLPITDDRMTRFWITLDQGVDFVLSSLEIMRGGEIFVPKIPSMKMTELVEAMVPGAKTRIIGIRPGEKLHEMMISSDDARNTVDLGDRYAIEPDFVEYQRKSFRRDGHSPVPDGFVYSSDNNADWLDKAALLRMLEG